MHFLLFFSRPHRAELAVALRAFEVLRVENAVLRDGRREAGRGAETEGELFRANEEGRRETGVCGVRP